MTGSIITEKERMFSFENQSAESVCHQPVSRTVVRHCHYQRNFVVDVFGVYVYLGSSERRVAMGQRKNEKNEKKINLIK